MTNLIVKCQYPNSFFGSALRLQTKKPTYLYLLGIFACQLLTGLWCQFSGFRGEFKNISWNQRPGRHLGLPVGPENWNLVEDVEILLPVKFHWNPFRGARGKVENVSAPQRRGCFFPIGQKNTNVMDDIESLFPVNFPRISFSGFGGEVDNVSANERPGGMAILVFLSSQETQNLVEDVTIFRLILLSCLRGEVEKVSASQRQGWASWFSCQQT